jgi:hypothetical protein
MIKDMYERIFKVVKEITENDSQHVST